jgi:hypothetical protein
VHAFGRAGNKAEAKAHIISRARALGATDALPDGWDVSKSLLEEIEAASATLHKTALALFREPGTTGKPQALAGLFKAYDNHLRGIVPQVLTKAGETDMADKTEAEKKKEKEIEEAKKNLDAARAAYNKAKGGSKDGEEPDGDDEGKDAEHKEMKKEIAKLKRQLAIAKLSPVHQDYMDAHDWDDRERQNFLEKTPEERDEHIDKNPIAKSAKLPEAVRKALDEAAQNAKIVKALQEKDEIATFAKRATSIGLVEEQGEVLRKAYSGDAAAQAKLDSIIKGLREQVRVGKLFEERGSALGGRGDAGSAAAELNAKVDEYMKANPRTERGKPMTRDLAFTKVYVSPENIELKKRFDLEDADRKRKAGVAA